jgi:alginate O-acetyltransferase complex protein AlgJ
MTKNKNSSANESSLANIDLSDGAEATSDGMPNKVQKVANLVIIAVFLSVIGLPFADMFLGIDQTASSENRNLARAPQAITTLLEGDTRLLADLDLADLQRQFKAYIADHFGCRNLMIRQHGLVKFHLLGVSSSPLVILGQRDQGTAEDPAGLWLYYNKDKVVEQYRSTAPFSLLQLERWRLVLENRRNWLAGQGIRFLFVIAANKHTVYPEYLPNEINRVNEQTPTDQLIAYLHKHTDLEILDTRTPLWQSRKRNPHLRLFLRTDTHWNEVGAFKAYEFIAQHLRASFPSIQPLTWNDFVCEPQQHIGGDLAGILGIKDQFQEIHMNLNLRSTLKQLAPRDHISKLFRTGTGRRSQPRLLMLRDSFGKALVPLLAHHFESAFFIKGEIFGVRTIKEQKPDIVIWEIVERRLMRHPPELNLALQGQQGRQK